MTEEHEHVQSGVAACLLLGSCGNVGVEHYAQERPKLDLAALGDVIGEARGEVAGNTLRWRYQLDLPVDGRHWQVDLDDWMYLMDDDTLINRSSMSKLGVEIGQITLFFRRLPEGTP